jgi:hypothetical protein
VAARGADAFIFAPSAANGLFARGQLHDRLAESLAHIFERTRAVVGDDTDRVEALISALRGNARLPPALFARYFNAIAAIEADDIAAITEALAHLLAEQPILAEEPRLRIFSGPDMAAGEAALIAHHFPMEHFPPTAIGSFAPGEEEEAVARFSAALDLLREAAPRTHAEISATVSEIILAKGPTGDSGYTFDGASSLQYWGAILVNAANKKTLLQTCEMIAHEAAHNVLFGMSPRTFFVTNDDRERYNSPLRDDPRPLDGIYHATFVLARMHFAISEMLRSGRLTDEQVDEASRLTQRSAKYFADGAKVLEDHATFTENGRGILAAAKAYMVPVGKRAPVLAPYPRFEPGEPA